MSAQAISPELALVDPALASTARAALASYDRALPDVFELLERHPAVPPLAEELRPSPVLESVASEDQPPWAVPREMPEPPGVARSLGSVVLKLSATAVLAAGGLLAARQLTADNQGSSALPNKAVRPVARGGPAIGGATSFNSATASAGATRKPRPAKHRQRGHSNGVAVPKRSSAPALAGTGRASSRASRPAGRARSTPPALQSPSVRTRRAGPVLTWRSRPAATYYRVQIFRARSAAPKQAFLFEVWTSRPRLAVPSFWLNGRQRQPMGPGKYRWYAYAVFGAKGVGAASSRTNAIAHGWFAIGATR